MKEILYIHINILILVGVLRGTNRAPAVNSVYSSKIVFDSQIERVQYIEPKLCHFINR